MYIYIIRNYICNKNCGCIIRSLSKRLWKPWDVEAPTSTQQIGAGHASMTFWKTTNDEGMISKGERRMNIINDSIIHIYIFYDIVLISSLVYMNIININYDEYIYI